MTNQSLRLPENVPGAFYINDSCIDCDLCRESVPAVFRRHDDIGMSIVYRQPENKAVRAAAIEAMQECPTDSIQMDMAK